MKYIMPALFFLILLFSSCATMPLRIYDVENDTQRGEIVEYAQGFLGELDLTRHNGWFRNDCSGFVVGVYRSLGYRVRLTHAVGSRKVTQVLYRSLRARGLTYFGVPPKKADLVFFKGTTDEMRDGISHVGMVADVLGDGTIVIIHYSSKGVSILRMNLEYPDVYRDNKGDVMNDFLKKRSPQQRKNEKLLSGQLFFGFGDLLRYARGSSTHS